MEKANIIEEKDINYTKYIVLIVILLGLFVIETIIAVYYFSILSKWSKYKEAKSFDNSLEIEPIKISDNIFESLPCGFDNRKKVEEFGLTFDIPYYFTSINSDDDQYYAGTVENKVDESTNMFNGSFVMCSEYSFFSENLTEYELNEAKKKIKDYYLNLDPVKNLQQYLLETNETTIDGELAITSMLKSVENEHCYLGNLTLIFDGPGQMLRFVFVWCDISLFGENEFNYYGDFIRIVDSIHLDENRKTYKLLGFDSHTNKSLYFGGIHLSIPSYYKAESNTSTAVTYGYTEDSKNYCGINAECSNLNYTSSQVKELSTKIGAIFTDYIKNSVTGARNMTKVSTTMINNYNVAFCSFSKTIDSVDVKCDTYMFINPSSKKLIHLSFMYSGNLKYKSKEDFKLVLSSIS